MRSRTDAELSRAQRGVAEEMVVGDRDGLRRGGRPRGVEQEERSSAARGSRTACPAARQHRRSSRAGTSPPTATTNRNAGKRSRKAARSAAGERSLAASAMQALAPA